MQARWVVVAIAVTAGCMHAAPPTISGADLYAQVQALRAQGRVTVAASPDPLVVRTDQVLVSADGVSQAFEVSQIIERCRGGNPELDVDCTLALLRGQRFRVANTMPTHDEPRVSGRASSGGKVVLGAIAIGAPLTYGVARCDFPGCQVVFGIPLALGACLLALATLGPD